MWIQDAPELFFYPKHKQVRLFVSHKKYKIISDNTTKETSSGDKNITLSMVLTMNIVDVGVLENVNCIINSQPQGRKQGEGIKWWEIWVDGGK